MTSLSLAVTMTYVCVDLCCLCTVTCGLMATCNGYTTETYSYFICVGCFCLNNGSCNSDGVCECPDGFTGELCEQAVCKLYLTLRVLDHLMMGSSTLILLPSTPCR